MINPLSPLHKLLEIPAVFTLSQRLGNGTLASYWALIKIHVQTVPTDKILDIGCGTGAFSDGFGCDYYGIDHNAEYIEMAQQTRPGNFIATDSAELNFSDGEFDHLISIAVFHHLSDEQVINTLKEGLRVCKPGGTFHVVEAIYPQSRRNPLKWLIFYADRGRHQRRYDELIDLIKSRFQICEATTRHGFPHDTCYIGVQVQK
jgi:ubiquinone/menaquinone biosynthesis C-methylase UbiE